MTPSRARARSVAAVQTSARLRPTPEGFEPMAFGDDADRGSGLPVVLPVAGEVDRMHLLQNPFFACRGLCLTGVMVVESVLEKYIPLSGTLGSHCQNNATQATTKSAIGCVFPNRLEHPFSFFDGRHPVPAVIPYRPPDQEVRLLGFAVSLGQALLGFVVRVAQLETEGTTFNALAYRADLAESLCGRNL